MGFQEWALIENYELFDDFEMKLALTDWVFAKVSFFFNFHADE